MAKVQWTTSMLERLRKNDQDEVLRLLESLGTELQSAAAERKRFLARPVTVPEDIDQNAELVEGIQNLAQGKRPFGLAGLFGKGAEKKALDSIRVVSSASSGQEDWQHVLDYVFHLKRLRDLVIRWNAVARVTAARFSSRAFTGPVRR